MNKVLQSTGAFWNSVDWKALLKNIREFFNSYVFYIFETLAACLFVATSQEVVGAVLFCSPYCLYSFDLRRYSSNDVALSIDFCFYDKLLRFF